MSKNKRFYITTNGPERMANELNVLAIQSKTYDEMMEKAGYIKTYHYGNASTWGATWSDELEQKLIGGCFTYKNRLTAIEWGFLIKALIKIDIATTEFPVFKYTPEMFKEPIKTSLFKRIVLMFRLKEHK